MIYKLELTTQEAQVVYQALSSLAWVGSESEADLSVRYQLEKISVKKYGRSLHDHLVDRDGIRDTGKPDIRTMKEKILDLKGEQRS